MLFYIKMFLLFFLFGIVISSHGQNTKTDSLIRIIHQPKYDTNKVYAAASLASLYLQKNNLDSAAIYNNKQWEYSERLNWVKGKMSYFLTKNSIFQRTGKSEKGLEALLEALKLSEKTKDFFSQSYINWRIGQFYNWVENYKEALSSYRLAIKIKEQAKIPGGARVYSDFADAFYNADIIDSALVYQNKALEMALAEGDKATIAVSYCNLGNINSKLEKINIAKEYYKESLVNATTLNYGTLISEVCMGLANIYKKMGTQDSSLYYARRAYYFSSKSENFHMLIKAATFLQDYYKVQKTYDSLSKYQGILIVYKDSIYSNEKLKKIEELRINEIYRQQELKAKLEKGKEYRKRTIQLSLIAVFIPVFGSIVFLLSRKRKKNSRVIILLGVASLLMLFEFISLLIHPSFEKITNHNVILMYLALLLVAAILVPLHHRLEKFVKSKL